MDTKIDNYYSFIFIIILLAPVFRSVSVLILIHPCKLHYFFCKDRTIQQYIETGKESCFSGVFCCDLFFNVAGGG